MKNYTKQKAFTLVELLVIIAIIGIIVSAWTQINVNNIWDDNRLIIFNNKIISQYETLRNNALLWKWIDSDIGVPEAWKLSYSLSASWTITPSYSSWASWISYSGAILTTPNFYELQNIECLDLSKSLVWTWSNAEIIINWNDFSLWWDCVWSSKILKFSTKFKNDTADIYINTINWLIEVQ